MRRIPSVEPSGSGNEANNTLEQKIAQPEEINLNVSDFDLANVKSSTVIVGCWLDERKLKWGIYKQRHTAIMHLTIEASHPSDFAVEWFEVDLIFSMPTMDLIETRSHLSHRNTTTTAPGSCAVHLLGKPAPSSICDVSCGQQSRWSFSGHRFAPTGGPATTAQWKWLATKSVSSISECGDLHCGVIVQHGGPEEPMHITYHVTGQARHKDMKDVYQRPYRFSSRDQKSRPWLLKPRQAEHDLTDNDIEGLNKEIINKYEHTYVGE